MYIICSSTPHVPTRRTTGPVEPLIAVKNYTVHILDMLGVKLLTQVCSILLKLIYMLYCLLS